MLNWSFNEYESLPLLVALLLDKDSSRSEATLDEFYNLEPAKLHSELLKIEENILFFEQIKQASIDGFFKIPASLVEEGVKKIALDELYLEPVSFFRWAEKLGYQLTFNVKCNVDNAEKKIRINEFAKYRISKSTVSKKMNEPLWDICSAVLYLHGFEPAEIKNSIQGADSNFSIVNSEPSLKQIITFLNDSAKIGTIELFSGGNFKSNKVKPKEFMEWARTLNMDFSNLVLPKEQTMSGDLKPKERNTLLKLLLGLALTNYEYNPQASKNSTAKDIVNDLSLHGLHVDEDTVRKWLNQSKEFLPVEWTPNS